MTTSAGESIYADRYQADLEALEADVNDLQSVVAALEAPSLLKGVNEALDFGLITTVNPHVAQCYWQGGRVQQKHKQSGQVQANTNGSGDISVTYASEFTTAWMYPAVTMITGPWVASIQSVSGTGFTARIYDVTTKAPAASVLVDLVYFVIGA